MEFEKKIKQQNNTLKRMFRQVRQLNEMRTEFQSSDSLEDIARIVCQYAEELFSDTDGVLYLFRSDVERFEISRSWGSPLEPAQLITGVDQESLVANLKALETGRNTAISAESLSLKEGSFYLIPGQEWIVGLLQVVSKEPPGGGNRLQSANIEAFLQSTGLAISNMKMREWLRYDAIADPLTGLYNRRFLSSQLEREISRAVRQRSLVSVVMLDINQLKQVNKTFGHQVGDQVLTMFSKLLQNSIRKEDYACRIGGDEFMLILPDSTHDEAMQIVQRIQQGAWLLGSESPELAFEFSYGQAVFPEHGEDAKQIIKIVEHFLLEAKQKKLKHGVK